LLFVPCWGCTRLNVFVHRLDTITNVIWWPCSLDDESHSQFYFFNVLYSNGWQQIVHEEQVTIWLMLSSFFNYSIHLSIHYKVLTHHKYFYISLARSRRSNTIKWHKTPMTMSSPWLCYSKIHTSIFSQV
jgi:hypothetical protein